METEQHKEELRNELKKLIRSHNGFQNKRLFIFGFSYISQAVLYKTLEECGVRVEAFLDNSPEKIDLRFGNTTVISPKDLPHDKNVFVLIHSAHAGRMIEQLKEIDASIGERILHLEYPKKDSDGLWKEEVYQKSLRMLRDGEAIYKRIAADGRFLVVGPEFSLGDYGLFELTLHRYLERRGIQDYKVVACGKGAAAIVGLFHEAHIETLNLEEMRCLLKYVMFMGEDNVNAIMVCPQYFAARRLFHLYPLLRFCASEMYPRLVYQIDVPYEPRHPDIFQPLDEPAKTELAKAKGKGLILAPHANTSGALPAAFWTGLIAHAKECGYTVYTNVSGTQEELPGTLRLEVPFSQMGTAMEAAGTFVSLRSGINDVTGRAKCRQIVIYPDVYKTFGIELHGFDHGDLRALGVSPDAIQLVVNEQDMRKTADEVVRLIIGNQK